jgi:hypothetical protein
MTTFHPLFRALGTAALIASLAACTATAPVAPPAVPKLSDMLAQASQAEKSGNKEQAVTLWKQAATAYPTDKTPWGNVAKTRFDAGLYGEAIMAAEEVLIRDPNDKAAHSIIATSGVRLATKSVGALSRMNGFSGSLRTESQQLAETLRQSLGLEDGKVIFAEKEKEAKEPVKRSNRSNSAKAAAKSKVEGKADAKGGDALLDIFK